MGRIADIDLVACILFYEKLDQTIECIKSLLPSGVNIYILNNGSSAPSREALGAFCDDYKQVAIFDSEINLGVSGGRNYLLTHTGEEWLLWLDNDIVVKTVDWLEKFIQHVSMHRNIEVFVPKLFNAVEGRYESFRSIRIEWPRALLDLQLPDDLINRFPGGASFTNRRLFDRLGIYDEQMFVGYQDFELCIRGVLSEDPVRGRLIHDIELIHEHRPANRNQDKDAILTRYNSAIIEASFNHIVDKHNIILEDDWFFWSRNQIERMMGEEDSIAGTTWRKSLDLVKKAMKRNSKSNCGYKTSGQQQRRSSSRHLLIRRGLLWAKHLSDKDRRASLILLIVLCARYPWCLEVWRSMFLTLNNREIIWVLVGLKRLLRLGRTSS